MTVFVLVFVASLCELVDSPCPKPLWEHRGVYALDRTHYFTHAACKAQADRLNNAAKKTAIKGDPRLYAACARARADDET